MMKFLVIAAVCAAGAFAAEQIDDVDGLSGARTDGSIATNKQAFVKDIKEQVDSLAGGMGGVYDTMNAAAATVRAVDKMQSDAADLNGSYEGAKGAADGSIDRAEAAAEAQFAAAELELEQLMMDLEAEKDQTIHAAAVKTAATVGALVDDLDAGSDELTASTNTLKARLAKHAACAQSGSVYDSAADSCNKLEIPASQTASKVHHSIFTSNDGRDSGYVNARTLKFVKKQDATYMRIWYHDNFRVHGHTAHAQWDVMICDANGNGCAECKDPGKVQHWRYGHHQHNWWMNDHWSASIFGICRKSDNRELKKGTYQLRVRIDNNRNDIYTGHNQHNILMVDEVLKG